MIGAYVVLRQPAAIGAMRANALRRLRIFPFIGHGKEAGESHGHFADLIIQ